MSNLIPSARFERIDFYEIPADQGEMLSRWRDHHRVPNDMGDFLSRLWALYGKPDYILYGGYDYNFYDSHTGQVFSAYCENGIPGYRGVNPTKLKPVIQVFDELLRQTMPADCFIVLDTTSGPCRVGARHGVPFCKPAL